MKTIGIFCLAAAVLAGGTAGRADMTVEDVLAGMERAGKSLTTLKCDFRQVRVYSLFDEKRESSGTIYYKRPERMLWRYAAPDSSEIYINGERALMYLPDIRQVQRISLLKDRKTRSLLIGFGNSAVEIRRNFSARLLRSGGETYTIELTPKAGTKSSGMLRLEMTVDGKSWLPVKTIRFEPGGDRTIFTFSNVKTNVPLKDSLFEFRIPEGTEVVDYQ